MYHKSVKTLSDDLRCLRNSNFIVAKRRQLFLRRHQKVFQHIYNTFCGAAPFYIDTIVNIGFVVEYIFYDGGFVLCAVAVSDILSRDEISATCFQSCEFV